MKRTIEIIEQELDKARDESQKHFEKAPPGMDFDEFHEYMQAVSSKVSKLSREYRLLKEPVFREPDYFDDDIMSLSHFIECVECGGFIDYDGFGCYVRDGKVSDIEIYPSDLKHNSIRKDFDTIVWYNR